MGIHIRYLRPAVVSDMTHAEEDVPLIQDGRVTEAGEIYLDSLEDDGMNIELRELVMNGRFVEAIRLYRDLTGASLLAAKNHVDALRGR